jgi:phosphoribosylaminoimidazolecarboxamide formyltransferase/IMP cyclohydrolase
MSIERALLSVWDKTGIVEFARGLIDLGVEVVSTGGTAASLRNAALAVTELSQVTGFPELLGGRVKTLHPMVHGGLLAVRSNPEHMADLARHSIRPIDLVAVTLYPFETAIANGANLAGALEQIDIGGVTLLRAAAKNFEDVIAVSRASQYEGVLDELRRTGVVGRETRRRLAGEAFARTSEYDAAIARYLRDERDAFPQHLLLAFEKLQDLRYGENPHQRGAFYRELGPTGPSVAAARQISGRSLSYNNIFDLDTALELVQEFPDPAAVIVKHAIPCGVGVGETLRAAYLRAREGDPISAFGGIVALNRPADRATAEAVAETFLEALIAPEFREDALVHLAGKKNLRLLAVEMHAPDSARAPMGRDLRRVRGGLLVQDWDAIDLIDEGLKVVTSRPPTEAEWRALRFAWTVCRYVRSNGIVFARDRQTVGIGSGQTNRVEAVRLAARQAGERARGAAMASEAFFPFPDAVEAAALAGISAVIQPGGSIRDAEVTAAADAAGLAMVFTGIRHFKH